MAIDVCWRMLIVAMIVLKLECEIIDEETAFLFGDSDEEVHMTCDAVHEKDEVLLLIHATCGLVQGFPDPCLCSKRDELGIVFLAVWVDDSLLVGDGRAIEKVIEDLKREGFSLKEDGSLDDCLSCEITMDKLKTVGWIHQPHLLTKLRRFWFFGGRIAEPQDAQCSWGACDSKPWRRCGQ